MMIAIVIFVLMYAGMLIFSKYRVWFASGAAIAMVICKAVSIVNIPGAINWNVLMMIAGTMGIVTLFIDTGMPSRMADVLLSRMPNACWAIVALSAFAGVISAFVDNVATVLMVAPVALAVVKKLNINPVPVIISIAVSSNLQGAATLVGDTTSILLGDYAGMTFTDFIIWKGRASIFWAVELGALGTIVILWLLFRREKQPVVKGTLTPVKDVVPATALLLVVICLIIVSFFEIPYVDDIKNGLICLTICVIDIVWCCIKAGNTDPIKRVIKGLDYQTIIMLCGLFVVIYGIIEVGVIDSIADWFVNIGSDNTFLLYTVIVFASVIISAFVDNIPYMAAMLPVVSVIANKLGIDSTVLYFGLLSGATLGGNITPFGASANVAGIGILKKEGYEVKTTDFMRIGIPFTLTAVVIGYLFTWAVWGN